MVEFKAELSQSSIDALIKDLKKYQQDLDNSLISINQAIADKVYELVMSKVPRGTSGDLARSIEKEVTKEFARVYTTNEHALYAEFGTGIVGAKSPHPEAEAQGWLYDINSHGEEGWFYNKGTRENPDIYWTKGYAGKKYMYYAYIEIQKKLEQITTEVLKQRGLI
jgi:hypothetical protein